MSLWVRNVLASLIVALLLTMNEKSEEGFPHGLDQYPPPFYSPCVDYIPGVPVEDYPSRKGYPHERPGLSHLSLGPVGQDSSESYLLPGHRWRRYRRWLSLVCEVPL